MIGLKYSDLLQRMKNLEDGEKLYFCNSLGQTYVYDKTEDCSYNMAFSLENFELKKYYFFNETTYETWYLLERDEIDELRNLFYKNDKPENSDGVYMVVCDRYDFKGHPTRNYISATRTFEGGIEKIRSLLKNSPKTVYSNNSKSMFIIIENDLKEDLAWAQYYITKISFI